MIHYLKHPCNPLKGIGIPPLKRVRGILHAFSSNKVYKTKLIDSKTVNSQITPTLLSTKTLTTAQKELVLNAGLGLVEHDFIKTKRLVFETPKEVENLIFTSQNAIRFFFESVAEELVLNEINVFCVGLKTKAVLERKGLKVVEMQQNSTDLGRKIAKNYQNEQFLFICGKHRRDELPDILEQNKVAFDELIVYETVSNTKEISRKFEGLLFFSPSGVQSYVSKNTIGSQHCFCIGNTTANEVEKYTNAITIANKPTIENVIVQAVKKLQ